MLLIGDYIFPHKDRKLVGGWVRFDFQRLVYVKYIFAHLHHLPNLSKHDTDMKKCILLTIEHSEKHSSVPELEV